MSQPARFRKLGITTKVAVAAILTLVLIIGVSRQASAATTFSDNFNRADNPTVGNGWVEVNTGLGNGAVSGSNLVFSSSAVAGRSYVVQDTTLWSNTYTQRLNRTVGQVSWRWNLRVNRANLSGFGAANYGVGFVLAASSSDFLTGSGYAVVWGQNLADPLRLVLFTNGLQTSTSSTLSNLITASSGGFTNLGTAYYSFGVTYDPDGDVWELAARDDGVVGFADPNSGTLTVVGTVTNNTYTGTLLNYMGALWNYGTVAGQSAFFDEVTVAVLQLPPTIVTPPQSQLGVLGSSVNLTVTAKGTQPLRYQWRFNGSDLGGQTNPTLSLANFQPGNEGDYTVVVTNNYGAITSAVATVTINRDYGDAPPPYPTLVGDNGARHLFVPGIYLGATVDGETNGRPDLSAATEADDDGITLTSALISGQLATLQVMASTNGYLNAWLDCNQNGSWADPGEQIFVNQLLAPGVNNLNLTVPANAASGTNAYARFRFSTASGLTYTGAANDGEVEDYQFAINSTADLAVSMVAAPDPVAVGSNLTYTVIVSNHGPSQATGVLLTNVLPASVALSSVVSSQGTWTQNGHTVTCALGMLLAGAPATVTIVVVPATATIVNGTSSVGGNEPDGALANNTASINTTVHERPVITSQPQSLTVTNGDNADFSVSASGTGALLYQWRFNGGNLTGRTNPSLTISNAALAHAGTYDVLVQDAVGHVFSAPATLTVLVPPTITNQPQTQLGNLGGAVSFNVGAAGTTPFSYQWYFNASNALSGATTASLTLTNLQTTNAGNYTVSVSNTGGAVTSAVAVLTVAAMDFGDAPTNYPTLLAANGARHVLVSGIRLGAGASQDADGKPNAPATGDDLDDGITFTNTLVAGQIRWVKVVASTNGLLDAWLDFDQNGSWGDASEQIFTSRAVTNGTNVISFTVPFTAVSGTTFARFRFSTAGGLAPTGVALDGEVEDYAVTVGPATPTQLMLYTDTPAEAIAGVPFDPPPVVQVADNLGQRVFSDNTTVVTATRLDGAGTLQGTLTATAVNGWVTFPNLYHTLATNLTLRFSNPSLGSVTSSVVTVYAATPGRLAIKTQPSATVTAGTAFAAQPVVRVEDAFGNLISDDSGQAITVTRNLGSGTLQGSTTATTTNGIATFSGLAHNTANTINLAFDTTGLSGVVSSNITVNPTTATRLAFTTSPGNATIGSAFGIQPVVKSQDTYGNNSTVGLAPNKTVTFALTSGDGPLQGTTSANIGANGGNGTINCTDLRIDVAGTNKQLTASTSNFTNALSSIFTVNGGPASKLTLAIQPSTNATAGVAFGQQPVIRIEDANGNLRTQDNSTVVTAVRVAGAGTLQGATNLTAVNGMVTYTNLAHLLATNITIQFTSGSLSNVTSGTITVSPAPANRLTIVTQPSATATAGMAFAQQPVVRVEDGFGNFRFSDNGAGVIAARAGGSGALQGMTTISVTNGIAAFTNLSHQIATNITLQFSSGALSNATSGTVAVQAATASQLAFARQPAGAVVGSVFGTQPIVVCRDSFGNDSTVGLPLHLNLNLAAGSLLGTTNLDLGAAAGNGTGSFTDLRIDSAGTNKQLTASASGMTTATSMVFAVAKADQAISFAAVPNKNYGDPAFVLSASASSGLPVAFSVMSGSVNVTGSNVTIIGVGGVTLRANQAGNDNYNPAMFMDHNFIVATAPLNVVADNYSRASGTTNPIFTGTILGIQYGDNITASYVTTAMQNSPAGSYSITPVLADPDSKLPNYTLAFTNGVLTVTNALSAPLITDLSVSGNVLTLSFTTESGRTNRVEFKGALDDVTWSHLTNVLGNGAVMVVTDDVTSAQHRFYRVVLQ